jgi:PIN domain nuclease of toxin-antitoxin system
MRLLLDTQLAIWWQIRPASISANVEQKVQSAAAVFVSRASLWEMAIKIGLGKLNVDLALFAQHIEATGFQWLDIKTEHILRLSQLPTYEDHKDPFDRLLIAQSRSEPMILLTADAKLERYGSLVEIA